MSAHEGIKYQCDFCDYKATQKNALKTHKMSVHEGIRYQCDHYKATHKSALKRHKIFSQDFEGMFPNLNIPTVCRVAAQEFYDSNFQFLMLMPWNSAST